MTLPGPMLTARPIFHIAPGPHDSRIPDTVLRNVVHHIWVPGPPLWCGIKKREIYESREVLGNGYRATPSGKRSLWWLYDNRYPGAYISKLGEFFSLENGLTRITGESHGQETHCFHMTSWGFPHPHVLSSLNRVVATEIDGRHFTRSRSQGSSRNS